MSFSATKTFFTELRVLTNEIGKDCKELRSSVERPALRSDSTDNLYFGSTLIEQIGHQMQNVEDEVAQLEKYPGLFSPFSFQHILATCESFYNLNEQWMETIESTLEQYGYEKSFSSTIEKEAPKSTNISEHKHTEVDVIENPSIQTKIAPSTPPSKPTPIESIGTPRLEDFISATTLQMLQAQQKPNIPQPTINESKQFELSSPPSFSKTILGSPPATPLLTPADISMHSNPKKSQIISNSVCSLDSKQPIRFESEDDVTDNYSLLPVSQFVQTPQLTTEDDDQLTSNYLHLSRKMKKVTAGPFVISAIPNVASKIVESTKTAVRSSTIGNSLERISLLSPTVNNSSQIHQTAASQKNETVMPSLQQGSSVKDVTQTEMTSLPAYLQTQVKHEELNAVIRSIVSFISEKQLKGKGKENGEHDVISETELKEDLKLGTKVRVILLALIQLKRIRSVFRNNASFFAIM